jgi:hypothetical protein
MAKVKLPKFAKRHYERLATVIQGLILSHDELSEVELDELASRATTSQTPLPTCLRRTTHALIGGGLFRRAFPAITSVRVRSSMDGLRS